MGMAETLERLEPRISIITLLVSDLDGSFRFYAHGLGFPTSRSPESGWVGFRLQGICLCIYPYARFAAERLPRQLDAQHAFDRTKVPSIGLAYNTRHKHEVAQVLELARRAGGSVEKAPEETFWGGYSGYFSDPDGHLWEVAWAESWKFHPDGSLVVD